MENPIQTSTIIYSRETWNGYNMKEMTVLSRDEFMIKFVVGILKKKGILTESEVQAIDEERKANYGELAEVALYRLLERVEERL